MPKSARAEVQPASLEDEITQAAIERLQEGGAGRMQEMMISLTRHLHGFIRDVEPTEEEWMAAIRFLTATGKKCDDQRQEFILLSDTLGATMLVDAINHRKPGGATESSVLGPFYREGAPDYENGADLAEGETGGESVLVSGRVVDLEGGPIAGAVLDIWQTAPDAIYAAQDPSGSSYNLCGRITTEDDGRYWFRTRKPVSYTVPGDGPVGAMLEAAGRHNWRPAHIHFMLSAAGYETLVTQLFTDDDPYLDTDAVFGVKDSLVVHYERGDEGLRLDHDFVMTAT
ncbi:MAG: 6-chlorohydroxyquinol-1,2-dioxygenase [Rhodospirillales bacterium]|nr:6-chlorohydroxyquinol-1,2-dioxygenase [Rhodospirillales bacterium]MDE0378174.1 6-chlorohydroxyquinol-1,2-dioxygenase [Rhodospirillales bacterium]